MKIKNLIENIVRKQLNEQDQIETKPYYNDLMSIVKNAKQKGIPFGNKIELKKDFRSNDKIIIPLNKEKLSSTFSNIKEISDIFKIVLKNNKIKTKTSLSKTRAYIESTDLKYSIFQEIEIKFDKNKKIFEIIFLFKPNVVSPKPKSEFDNLMDYRKQIKTKFDSITTSLLKNNKINDIKFYLRKDTEFPIINENKKYIYYSTYFYFIKNNDSNKQEQIEIKLNPVMKSFFTIFENKIKQIGNDNNLEYMDSSYSITNEVIPDVPGGYHSFDVKTYKFIITFKNPFYKIQDIDLY